MKHFFIVEPLVDPISMKLKGVEILTRFQDQDGKYIPPDAVIDSMNNEERCLLLKEQIIAIREKSAFFIENNLLCSLNVNRDMIECINRTPEEDCLLKGMDYVRLEISESLATCELQTRTKLIEALCLRLGKVWLDDMGAGYCDISMVDASQYELIKIDREYFWREAKKEQPFNGLVLYKKKCDKIVFEGVETDEQLELARRLEVWGVQGYLFNSCKLIDIESLTLRYDFIRLTN
ncbi:TPA: EAL domain-containing protein [Enterobacter ludwigii]|jgi:EAL domain-containing protein (putative c-di-GMP-specific phosphodiesterase class I)|uniref:EAL domain-containing protein n=1 Tax=Enterobacteriaceae TaxID=543 RepID=UPI00079A18D1|nr:MULTISPECIES: EAL domain-containing protein [Enterobacteriaceae]DAR60673.1 MAG TPA: c-di-GMP phosphodiesterase class I [Caudoviricetes sp.]ELK6458755.1 EAL domain-containing protein [Enterobacter ludwigii]MBK3197651.1 EAL domain-containing protein [Klebsiella pneumoniae]MEC6500315.1 EAL domain-containing protein [Klebsiella pneumoniae]SAB75336.1 diguanylate phosphodiesterase [Enterobacter ludwigii]